MTYRFHLIQRINMVFGPLPGLPVTLSTLQEEGTHELLKERASILADPPGAGKTWTTLATLTRDPKGVSRCLVVGPN